MTDINMNNLLDETLDDLEDLPSFKPYSPGAHRVLATFDTKEVNDSLCVDLSFKMLECLELSNPQDEAPKVGDVASTLFMLNNEFGRGKLKAIAKPFSEGLQLSTIRELTDEAKDVECVILTGIRTDKKDPDRKYLDVKEVQLV